MSNWQLLDYDREIFNSELDSFVPPRIFDSHLHLYDASQFTGPMPGLCGQGPPRADWAEFQRRIADITPDREITGLAFGFPAVTIDVAKANDFLAAEAKIPGVLGQMLTTPDMDPEFIRETVQRQGFVGLKPYHIYSTEKPTFDSQITSFLPDEHVRIAHELGLSITLHIVRAEALADPGNQETLQRFGARYPNARILLAHAARGFNPHHTIRGIESLRGLGNMWFDTSAVTDCGAFEAIIRVMGHERLLYGSDFPVTHIRGRCVGLGNNFLWLDASNTKLEAAYGQIQFTLVGIESLRCLKVAALSCGLTDEQIQDIFFGNAAQLFADHM